ncbi:MAG TPA: FAD-dependent oxidoreductase, partial [Candidatus Methylacidiphilales bacterium]
VQHHFRHLYGIPLRSLHSRNVGNLFFAGRNISATHVAFASTRVMGTCAVVGQAVGTAAALLRTEPGTIAEASTPEAVRAIQQALLHDDAFLPGLREDDPADLARSASIRADSEAEGSPATAVSNGLSRRIEADWGPWAEAATNRWESLSLPARIDFAWDTSKVLRGVHLTFCTGLDRELILSPSDHANASTRRGPQPETVRDYDLLVDGRIVLEVRGNHLRHRRHTLPEGCRGRTLSIEAQATHGHPTARLYQARVYGDA